MMKIFFAFLALYFCCQDVFAQNLGNNLVSEEQQKMDGLIVFPIHSVSQSFGRRLTEKQNTNTVHDHTIQASLHKTPRSYDLKLHDLPVLDQGNNDVPTFFATVTAINATLHPINDLSPMCLIQLDKYINPNPSHSIRVNNVLTLIQQYGIVPLNTQKNIGCAGVYDFDPEQKISVPISPEEYQNRSEIFYKKQVSWRYLFDDFSGVINSAGRLSRIKEALLAGKYVVLEYVVLPDLGLFGATGTHVVQNDTWVANDSMDQQMYAQILKGFVHAHAIVIIGYDNDATTVGSNGDIHKGLLKLRNSWGSEKGDHGDFYMTYDYMRYYGLSGIQFCLNQDEKNPACW